MRLFFFHSQLRPERHKSGGLRSLSKGDYGCGTVFELTVQAPFNGISGKATCQGQSLAFLSDKYGGLAHAAASLNYSSVAALRNGITAFCGS
jgi:hypothetical protein